MKKTDIAKSLLLLENQIDICFEMVEELLEILPNMPHTPEDYASLKFRLNELYPDYLEKISECLICADRHSCAGACDFIEDAESFFDEEYCILQDLVDVDNDEFWDEIGGSLDELEEPEKQVILVGAKPIKEGPVQSSESVKGMIVPVISRVIFAPPKTIVYWENGDKTVVGTQANEKFDKEKGLAMAILKYYGGGDSSYFKTFREFCGEESDFRAFLKKKGKKSRSGK